MDTTKIKEILDGLPESKQAEVLDFVQFLKHQDARERILSSDKEGRVPFDNTDALMSAIDNAD